MNGDDLKLDNLQSFLQRHKTHTNSRVSDIKNTIKKAESDHSFRKMGTIEFPPSLSRVTSQTPRSSIADNSQRRSILFKNDSNVSTTLSPASFLVDSLVEIDIEREARIFHKDSANYQNPELMTIKEGHNSFRSSYFKNNGQVESPSNKTDPGTLSPFWSIQYLLKRFF